MNRTISTKAEAAPMGVFAVLRSASAPGEASGRLGLAMVAIGLIILFSILNPSFFKLTNFITIGVNSTSVLIAVLGASALLIAGYVDLSIGSMLALIGIVVAKVAVATQDSFLAMSVGLILGAFLGFINGMLVRKLSISPLIVTLAMLALYGGLAFVVSSKAVYGFPPALLELGRGKIMGVQYSVIIAILIFMLGSFALTRTVVGLRIYAIGGDAGAAQLSGVAVGRMVVALYTGNGLLMGVIAVLTAGRLGSITPTIGAGFELDVLTAAILGGVAFTGGSGRPLGIAIGVATIGILNAGLIFVGLQSWWQSIAVGAMLLIALGADQYNHGRRLRHASKGVDLRRNPIETDIDIEIDAQEIFTSPAPGIQTGHTIFAIKNIEKTYGALRALGDVSFSVAEGEIVCLLGDNGAGKSTLVKIISGAITPDNGNLLLDEEEVIFRSPNDARRAGLETVYQDLALCPNLSVTHNMMLGREQTRRLFGIIPVRDDYAAAKDCQTKLKALGVNLLDDNALVSSLSGGQRQSVAIARSLTENVRLVCLDEPTAALGVKQTAQVINLIRKVAAKGTGVILVTHDLSTVRELADRIVVMSRGEISYDGSAKDMSADQLWNLMAGKTT